jgi:hypothetical protein
VVDTRIGKEVPKFEWKKLFDIDRDTGVFSLNTPLAAYSDYSIYVDASNLHAWGRNTSIV